MIKHMSRPKLFKVHKLIKDGWFRLKPDALEARIILRENGGIRSLAEEEASISLLLRQGLIKPISVTLRDLPGTPVLFLLLGLGSFFGAFLLADAAVKALLFGVAFGSLTNSVPYLLSSIRDIRRGGRGGV